MLEVLKSILLGIVQGITEWLPVSSTGHMILVDEFIQLGISSEAFLELFRVVIQLGSILAVIVLYFRKLNPFALSKSVREKRDTWILWFKVAAAVVPTVIATLLLSSLKTANGVALDDWVDQHLYNSVPVSVALIVYGVLFIVIERMHKGKKPAVEAINGISFQAAFAIGLFQVLSLIPGTSRSGSTILGAILLGLSRTAAAEFSFFMAIPTMLGASLIKCLKFADSGTVMQGMDGAILIAGCAAAFFVSLAVIKVLVNFVRRHSFSAFGVYRIILGAAVLTYFMMAR